MGEARLKNGLSLKKIGALFCLLTLVYSIHIPLAHAIPSTLGYRGTVYVNSEPYSGTGYFKIAIINESGDTLWSNDGTSSSGSEPRDYVEATVDSGVYSIMLGDADTEPLTASLFNTSEQLYVRTWFDDGDNGFSKFEPDIKLSNSMSAFVSQSLQGYTPEDFITSDAEIDTTQIADGAVTTDKIAAFTNSGKTFSLGNASDSNVSLTAKISSGATLPSIRYNVSTDQWEFSNDGSSFSAMASGAGDITAIVASTGLSGSAASGDATLTIDQNFAPTWTNSHAFTFAATENLSLTSDLAGAVNVLSLIATPSSTAAATKGIYVKQADSANTNGLDTAISIDNADTDLALTTGIKIEGSSTGTITTAIDVSDTEVDTAVAIGSNTITVGGVTLDATELSYLDGLTSNVQAQFGASSTGDITAVGDISTGAAFTPTAGADGNSLYFEGATTDANEIRLTGADPGADVTVTIPATTGTLLTTGDTGSVTSTIVLDNTLTATDLNATLTFLDSDLIDLSAINASSTTEGFKLPQAADVSAATAEGLISWDTDGDTLYVGTGAGVTQINTGGDITGVTAGAGLINGGTSGAVTLDAAAGTGITVNADDIAVNQATNFAWTGAHTYTQTVTATGAIDSIALTLGDDADVDTVAAFSIATTSAATGDADIVYGINIGNLGSADATVSETAINIGTGWDKSLTASGTIETPTLTLTGTGTLNGLDAIDATGETTLEAAIDIAGDVTGTGLGSVVVADNAVDGTDIALGSDASGDVMYYNGTDYVRLAKGSDGDVLTLASGLPSWAAGATGDVTAIGNCASGACFGGVTGTTLTSTTGEVLNMATVNTLLYVRDDAGTVTFMGKDDDADATTIYDTSGAGTITVGSADVTSITITTDGTGDAEVTLPSGSVSGTEILNDTVALTTDTSGNYVATITAGAGLTGDVSSEGATPTLAVGAGTGITANADDIAINQAFTPTWTGKHIFSKGNVANASQDSVDITSTVAVLDEGDTFNGLNITLTNNADHTDADTNDSIRARVAGINVASPTAVDTNADELGILVNSGWDIGIAALVSSSGDVSSSPAGIYAQTALADDNGANDKLYGFNVSVNTDSNDAGDEVIGYGASKDTTSTQAGGIGFYLVNYDTAAMTAGLLITTDAGTANPITTGVDVSDADIVSAVNIGDNPIITGNVAGTIGDVTTDSWTFVTDSTGNAEIVLPDGSVSSTEILDGDILEADLKAVDAANDEECLTYETTAGDFEWQACGTTITADLLDFTDLSDTLSLDASTSIDFDATESLTFNASTVDRTTVSTGLLQVNADMATTTAIVNGDMTTYQKALAIDMRQIDNNTTDNGTIGLAISVSQMTDDSGDDAAGLLVYNNAASTAGPHSLVSVGNLDTNTTVAVGLDMFGNVGGAVTTAIDADDTNIGDAMSIGDNAILGSTLTLTASTSLQGNIPDNVTDAADIQQSTNNYININTTNSSENISFGNAGTNPSYTFLGTGNVGIGDTSPDYDLEISSAAASDSYLALSDADVTHTFTDYAQADVYGVIHSKDSLGGGLEVIGFSDASDKDGLSINGIVGSSGAITASGIRIGAGKSNGATGLTAMAATETVLSINNMSNDLFNLLSGGNLGLGDTSPDYKLEIGADTGSDPSFALSDGDVSHGLTTITQGDILAHLAPISSTAGGAEFTAVTDADAQALSIRGIIGSTNPTDSTPAVKIVGAKSNGTTGMADLGAAETVFQVANNDDAAALTVLGNGALLSSKQVTVKTANYTITAAETGTVFTNEGAAGEVIFDLPPAVAGMTYTFVLATGQRLKINPDNADQIVPITNAAGDATSSAVQYESMTLTAINSTYWNITAVVEISPGDWTDDN